MCVIGISISIRVSLTYWFHGLSFRIFFLFNVIYHKCSNTPLGGVVHVLCSTTRCCAYDKVNNLFGSAVEELLRIKSCAFYWFQIRGILHMHGSSV